MKITIFWLTLATMAAGVLSAACSNNNAPHETLTDSGSPGNDGSTTMPGSDGGGTDGGAEDAEPTCYMNPQTYLQIINACTDAASVDKKAVLPLLQPDGSLPPLP